jgi:hypothetical protein
MHGVRDVPRARCAARARGGYDTARGSVVQQLIGGRAIEREHAYS